MNEKQLTKSLITLTNLVKFRETSKSGYLITDSDIISAIVEENNREISYTVVENFVRVKLNQLKEVK